MAKKEIDDFSNKGREVIFNFFFSSRRRHTRLQGDWSSDVCSSDLNERATPIYIWVPARKHDE